MKKRVMGLKIKQRFPRESIETVDHWAFLEEFEAPKWVDLALEAQSMDKDIDDAWFRTAHPFHQRTSHDLKSSFSLTGERKANFPEALMQSPNIPDSVSRSRGKDYKTRKWEGGNRVYSINKQHPIRDLGGKTSWVALGSDPLHSISNSTITSSYLGIKPTTILKKPIRTSNSKVSFVSGSNSTSTITSKSTGEKPEVSFEGLKNTSNSKMGIVVENDQKPKISQRHALRVEIKDKELSKGYKSYSGGSSVGSSLKPGINLKNPKFSRKMNNLESSKVAINAKVANNKGKASNVSKTSSSEVQDQNSNSKFGGKAIYANSACQDSKSKNVPLTSSRKPLLLRSKVEPLKEGGDTKSKQIVGASKFNRAAGIGKENVDIGVVQDTKTSKCNARVKDKNGLSDLKGRANGRNQGKTQKAAPQRVHFR